MSPRAAKRGLTIREVLVLLVLIAVPIALLLPAIQSAREAARRASCIDYLKQLGLAFHNFHDANKYFPRNGEVIGGTPATPGTVTGWSFLVQLLPYMEYGTFYGSLPIKKGDPVTSAGDPAVQAASDNAIPEWGCPSNPHSRFADPTGGLGRKYALTNYKGIGATCMTSLMMALTPDADAVAAGAPGDDPAKHPDGSVFPGNGLKLSDFPDGTAHTVICAETMDNVGNTGSVTGSQWLCATDVVLVGLPAGPQPPGVTGAVTFAAPTGSVGYWEPAGAPTLPPGFAYTEEAYPTGTAAYQAFRTYLAFNFAKDPDKGSYPALPYTVPNKPAFGPSSGHPNVVNHLMADGSVRSIDKHVDVAVYMFLITRAGNDPFRLW